jgi:ATP-dependent helicase YprA (DUF1998 family)
MRLDALTVASDIDDTYRRYLKTLMPVDDPGIEAAFHQALRSSPSLLRGPFLEMTPPYAPGATIRDLVGEGVLAKGMLSLDSAHLPVDRPLYRHQEQACRKAAQGRNIVVASGTGSGKTESFLLPILSSLLAEHEAGTLGPGVRAVLLYPMNALANDQMKRLRQLLAGTPQIAFGRYTGETAEDLRRAQEEFAAVNPREPLLANELICRQQMRAAPPHLLLTNYAMLEYLLLRPADMDLFEGAAGGQWRFVVVDEAHVYDGSKGAELALLLRRLAQRVSGGRALQCFATSATVGDHPGKVTRFARELFDVPFDWDPADPHRQDLIRAERRPVAATPAWGPLTADQLTALAALDDPGQELLTLARRSGVSPSDAAQAMVAEDGFCRLVTELGAGPQEAKTLAEIVFGGGAEPASLAHLVNLASALTHDDGTPVLSARYHFFARSTEGAFTCLSSEPHVYLARTETCSDCGSRVHEFASCRRCGAVHLVGRLRSDGIFEPRTTPTDPKQWLWLGRLEADVEDDDDTSLEDSSTWRGLGRRLTLCPQCGLLQDERATACAHGCTGDLRAVTELRGPGDELSGCVHCGARSPGTIRTLGAGSEAAVSVLATALYQRLPEARDPGEAAHPGQGRKILFFSDSRQQAAYFAPYLEGTYERLQQRRMLVLALQAANAGSAPVRIDDLVPPLVTVARRHGLFGPREGAAAAARRVTPWIVRELMALDGRQSLEGLGLLEVSIERPDAVRVPIPLLTLGLTEPEAWDLIDVLLRSVRHQGSLSMPADVDPSDEIFDPRRGPIYLREQKSEARAKVISWSPTRGRNRRVDFLDRLAARLGRPVPSSELLAGIWRWLLNGFPAQTPALVAAEMPYRAGLGHQLDHTALLLRLKGDGAATHRCSRCRQISAHSVKGVCPTMGCTGELQPWDLSSGPEGDDHYRNIYQTMLPVSLSVREHTAQWAPRQAAAIQQEFVEGKVNALSCSTTFELGVDVGDLQTVVLRNVPPSTANYVQRAGRAGRRAKSAALVLTYAQQRSHDLSRFAQPLDLIAGQVRAPIVTTSNERLARRHVHSIALSAFFRHAMTTSGVRWREAGAFFLPPEGSSSEPAPFTGVTRFLTPVPGTVRDALRQVVPVELHGVLGIEEDLWVPELTTLLQTVADELTSLVEFFAERRQEAFEQGTDFLVSRYGKVLATLRGRQLIGYLATKNVLPKYGFPVDVVELRTDHTREDLGNRLSLERDLSSAIYEYAPGSSIVAGGRVWTSAGIYRLPRRELVEARYLICRHCQTFHAGVDGPGATCVHCEQPLDGTPRTYAVPEFGFVAAAKSTPIGDRPPRQSWNGSTHVLKLPAAARETRLRVRGGDLTLRFGQRGRMVSLSEGPGGAGFRICDWCGFGEPAAQARSKRHQHPMSGRDCSGTLRAKSLAHEYETDLLEVQPRLADAPPWTGTAIWRSAMYGLLEGASIGLELAREDLDGALHYSDAGPVIALVDSVPGGAGLVLALGENFGLTVQTAVRRLSQCECDPATSCYACLRNYRNQRFHHELSRGGAINVLEMMLPAQ